MHEKLKRNSARKKTNELKHVNRRFLLIHFLFPSLRIRDLIEHVCVLIINCWCCRKACKRYLK